MIEYRSTDPSAPVVSGTSGSLKDALKAILTAGYGSKAAAGWANAFEAGNYIALRQGGGRQRYLAVNDDAAQMTRLFGYEVMTSATVGQGQFPTRAQVAGGLYVRKSISANATARPWICWANDTTFYMVVFGGSAGFDATGGDANFGFGETLAPEVGRDAFSTFIIGGTDTSTSSTAHSANRQVFINYSAVGSSAAGFYMARPYTQLGLAVAIGRQPNCPMTSSASVFAYPADDGSLNLARIHLRETLAVRGMMPGMWYPAHALQASIGQFDTVSGKAGSSLAGRTFTLYKMAGNGVVAIETTNTDEDSWHG
jgi:hypothetical protein